MQISWVGRSTTYRLSSWEKPLKVITYLDANTFQNMAGDDDDDNDDDDDDNRDDDHKDDEHDTTRHDDDQTT